MHHLSMNATLFNFNQRRLLIEYLFVYNRKLSIETRKPAETLMAKFNITGTKKLPLPCSSGLCSSGARANGPFGLWVRRHWGQQVHVISVKHFTSGYQSEIVHAVYIPPKFHQETICKPSNEVGALKTPTGQCEICKLL